MVDVNVNADVKGFGIPTVPAVEREDRSKPRVTPVGEGGDSSKAALDEKALHGKASGAVISEEETIKAVEQIQERLEEMGTRLNLSLHKEPDAVVVEITDRQSGEVIRQFPPEEVLQIRKKLDELVGMLFDKQA